MPRTKTTKRDPSKAEPPDSRRPGRPDSGQATPAGPNYAIFRTYGRSYAKDDAGGEEIKLEDAARANDATAPGGFEGRSESGTSASPAASGIGWCVHLSRGGRLI